MGLFSVITPQATENLFTDPQFGLDDPTTEWTVSGDGVPAATRSNTYQWVGSGSAYCEFGAGGSQVTVYQAVTVELSTYSLQAMVRRFGGGAVTNSHCQAYFEGAAGNWDSITHISGGWYRCVKTAGATPVSGDFGIRTLEDHMYVDAMQFEEQDEATTYCDGDQPGCVWVGYRHASTSLRAAMSRDGGFIKDLRDDLYLYDEAALGLGMPDYTELTQDVPLLPGKLYQRTKTNERRGTIIGTISGTSLANLHARRATLIEAFGPHRVSPEAAVLLRYNNGVEILELPVRYGGGLQGGQRQGFSEKVSLQLTAFEHPYWRSLKQEAVLTDGQSSVNNADYIIQRDGDGVWSAIGAASSSIYVLATGPDGYLYAGGNFTTIGGVAANYIAYWDGSSWNAMGAGVDDYVVSLLFDPAGNLFVGGFFTNAGGGAANRIAKWDGSSWSALGSGMSNIVHDMAWGPDGDLYAGGEFTTAGGGAANRIAKWNGASWSALGAGLDSYVKSIVFLGSTLFMGGHFQNAGGNPANRVAKWDGASWSALGSGMNDLVRALALTEEGTLYAGGDFTTADGITCQHVAQWNGVSWTPMGDGIPDNDVYKFAFGPDGILYAVGIFDEINDIESDFIGKWNGQKWIPMDMKIPASGFGYCVEVTTRNVLTFVYAGTGTATAPQNETLTNDGSADVYPVIKVTGPGRLIEITNYTLGLALYFDLDIFDGETVTLDLSGASKTFTSTFRGNIIDTIVPGSKLATWRLAPGDNEISIYIDDATAEVEFLWRNNYLSADGG